MPTQQEKPRKLFKSAPKFFTSPIKVGRDKIVIELPKGILAHMEVSEKKIHWTVINGILQISGTQPQVGIPLLTTGVEFQTQQ
jgi:hypothetical protein